MATPKITLKPHHVDPPKIHLRTLRFAYTGIACLGESSEWSEHDEPYLALGVLANGKVATAPQNTQTGVHEVNAGTVVEQHIPLYEGPPADIVLSVVIREQDQGSPDAFAADFQQVLQGAAAAAAAAFGGPEAAAAAGTPVADKVLAELSKGMSRILGAGDDTVGTLQRMITRDELINFANKPNDPDPAVPVPADYSFDLGSDSEGRYRVFFNTTWT